MAMFNEIFNEDDLEWNWPNALKYAAIETIEANCVNVSHMCIKCKKTGKCQIKWIHDAFGKMGMSWLLPDNEWNKLQRWKGKFHQLHHEKLLAMF